MYLTGNRAVSGGVSLATWVAFVDEDCCQAEQLVGVAMAVSFGISPRLSILRTK